MKRAFTLIELLIVIAIIAILALIAIPNFLDAQIRAQYARAQADMRSLATAFEAYFVDNNAYPRRNDGNSRYHDYAYWLFADMVEDDYPKHKEWPPAYCLTTPISYITSFPEDPFATRADDAGRLMQRVSYRFYNFHGLVGEYNRDESGWFAARWLKRDWHEPYITSPAPIHLNRGPQNTSRSFDEDQPTYWSHWAIFSYGPDGTNYNTGAPGYSACCTCWVQSSWGWFKHMVKGACDVYDPTNGTVSQGDVWRFQTSLE